MAIKLIRIQDPSFAESISATGKRAFADDGLQKVMYPPRLLDPTNPDEAHQFRIRDMRKRLVKNGAWSIAAVDEDVTDENGAPKVMGYAAWYEPGFSSVTAVLGDQQRDGEEENGWVDDGEGGLRGDGVKHPRCMDFKVYDKIDGMLKDAERMVLGEPPVRTAWYLGSLAVDPDFTGRGIASKLVQWGIDKAEQDNVVAFLESSPAAVGVYARLGFVDIKRLPPHENGHVFTVMVREPSEKVSPKDNNGP